MTLDLILFLIQDPMHGKQIWLEMVVPGGQRVQPGARHQGPHRHRPVPALRTAGEDGGLGGDDEDHLLGDVAAGRQGGDHQGGPGRREDGAVQQRQ